PPTAIPMWVASLSCSAVRASCARTANNDSSAAHDKDTPHQPRRKTGGGRSSYPSRSLRESLRSHRSFITWYARTRLSNGMNQYPTAKLGLKRTRLDPTSTKLL